MFMSTSVPADRGRSSQRGGITIIVALMLLVLLTIAAISMSRNSFREIVISGTTRQGAMVRNIADSGIEYGILWMQPTSLRQASATDTSAAQLQGLTTSLLTGQLYGLPYKLNGAAYSGTNTSTPPADLQVPAGSGNGFNLALTAMGKMPMTNQSQTAGSSSSGFTPASGNIALAAPDLWAIRSDGVYVAGGAMTFTHSKEAWISSPPR